MPLETAQLQTLLDAQSPPRASGPTAADLAQYTQYLLQLLASAEFADALEVWLEALVTQVGLATFVARVVPAFNQAVGNAWQHGRLGVYAEHRYTEAMRQRMTHALMHPPGPAHGLRVLLATPPKELHTLGLLALQVQLRLAGADVISLGAQMPANALLAAVSAYQARVVAISISVNLDATLALNYLQALRVGLPADCALWAGGTGCAALPAHALPGCEVFSDTSSAVLRWQNIQVK